MTILAIETSCDETGIAVMERVGADGDIRVHADITLSQAHMHAQFGGVFPNLARREHAAHIVPLIHAALTDAEMIAPDHIAPPLSADIREKISQIFHKEPRLLENFMMVFGSIPRPAHLDGIAVTAGPGLAPALWVGINTAEALGALWNLPVFPVNHMEGHIATALLSGKESANTSRGAHSKILTYAVVQFPALALLVSGGHTELVLMRAIGDYTLAGRTRDDAAGEAFDKVARILGLSYPGGPEISKLAASATADILPPTPLPRPMIHSGDFDFSFAGLKTAVLYMVKNIPPESLTEQLKAAIAREFENAAVEVLTEKTRSAALRFGARNIIVGGGVSANESLRKSLREMTARDIPDGRLYLPSRSLSGDNGLMIGAAILMRPRQAEHNIRANGSMELSRTHLKINGVARISVCERGKAAEDKA